MFCIRADLDNEKDIIKTPNFKEALIAAKIFYRNRRKPIGIWEDKYLKFLFYDGIVFSQDIYFE